LFERKNGVERMRFLSSTFFSEFLVVTIVYLYVDLPEVNFWVLQEDKFVDEFMDFS